jgi:hypothetical protein
MARCSRTSSAAILACFALLYSTAALSVDDRCIIEFLKQRNLLNETTFPNYFARSRSKDCHKIVEKIVKTLYEEHLDYVDGSASVDNKTYRECLKSEFDRHKMDEKFLKIKAFENEPQQPKLEKIRDDFLHNIKFICADLYVKVSTLRFKDFVSDKGGLSESMLSHPAIVKIKENLACVNRYAVEKEILDPNVFDLDLKLINQTDKDCRNVMNDVTTLIMDEWHIRTVSDDDAIQRCVIGIFLDTNAVDMFIKNSLLSQLQLSQEQKDEELKRFVGKSNEIQELSYRCMLNGFESI